jgi:hypothetical protein
VILMSGYADRDPSGEIEPLPVLAKPFNRAQLLQAIYAVLG